MWQLPILVEETITLHCEDWPRPTSPVWITDQYSKPDISHTLTCFDIQSIKIKNRTCQRAAPMKSNNIGNGSDLMTAMPNSLRQYNKVWHYRYTTLCSWPCTALHTPRPPCKELLRDIVKIRSWSSWKVGQRGRSPFLAVLVSNKTEGGKCWLYAGADHPGRPTLL